MDKKMAYLVTFFTNVSFCYNSVIDVEDENFQKCIFGFITCFYSTNKKIFDKVFDIKITDGTAKISIDFEGAAKYGDLYWLNPRAFCKMYDTIGEKDLNEIMKLAELFCYYVKEINELNYSRVKN